MPQQTFHEWCNAEPYVYRFFPTLQTAWDFRDAVLNLLLSTYDVASELVPAIGEVQPVETDLTWAAGGTVKLKIRRNLARFELTYLSFTCSGNNSYYFKDPITDGYEKAALGPYFNLPLFTDVNPRPTWNSAALTVGVPPPIAAIQAEVDLISSTLNIPISPQSVKPAMIQKHPNIPPQSIFHVVFGGKMITYGALDPKEFYCGLEYEVEAIQDIDYDILSTLKVQVTEDNSLKYFGRELITSPETVETHIKNYHSIFVKPINKGGCVKFIPEHERLFDPFNERTSTHVHVNCLGLTEDQVVAGTLFYAILEPLFFEMVDQVRRHNIHCVPLYDTLLFNASKWNNLTSIVNNWSKYTAFNLLPLKKQGTIEFRHHHGAFSLEDLEDWLLAIQYWYKTIQTNQVTTETIKDILLQRMSPKDLIRAICDHKALLTNLHPVSNEILNKNILNIKTAILEGKL